MLKFKHISHNQNTSYKNSIITSQNPESAKIKEVKQTKIKVKLFINHKKDNSKLNNSLILDTNRLKRTYQVLQCSDKPKPNSQIKRKINKNNNDNISKNVRPFALSAEKRKTHTNNNVNSIQTDKKDINIKKNLGNSLMTKEKNKIKIRKMNMNINISRFSNVKEKQKTGNYLDNPLSMENRGIITSSAANHKIRKKSKQKNIKEKEGHTKNKNRLEKSLDKLKINNFKKPYIVQNIIKKALKKESDKLNYDKEKITTDNDAGLNFINKYINDKEKTEKNKNNETNSNNNSKSSSSNSSSNENSSNENDSSFNLENKSKNTKKIKFKRNITDLSLEEKHNKSQPITSNKNVNEPAKIVEFKNQSQETKKDRISNNFIGSNKRFLKRRSVDNPELRDRLEKFVNDIMLKQNGGNTLFLTNYESGPSYEKLISLKINENKKIDKKIKIGICSKPGCSGPGIVKTNQDDYFIKTNFLENENFYFLGVCDGHGEDGHLVSKYVSKKLTNYITSLSNDEILSSFEKINSEIYSNSDINSNMSGTTVVSVIITPDRLISINLGDSRLSLFKYDNGIYYSKNLSREHKPRELDEKNRIISNGGRIQKCFDENTNKYFGPERVWLKSKEEPGLAMTRSLGDKIAHQIGVISEPEIKKFYYDGTEKFIIIASDGLWEYINSDQCINIIKKFYEDERDVKDVALELTKEAFKRWKRKETVIDDITVIVIFFY